MNVVGPRGCIGTLIGFVGYVTGPAIEAALTCSNTDPAV